MQIREKKTGLIADINISPILDLSLMLVIFLAVTTEFIAGGEIKVQVPEGGAAINAASQIVKLRVTKYGKISYKDKVYSDPVKLAAILPKDRRIYIEADKETSYMCVFTLLDALRKSGIRKVSLVGQRVE